MNARQKAYDTYDYSSRKLKVLESLSHQHNLYLIKTRKAPTIVNNKSTINVTKRQRYPVSKYFKVKSDQYLVNKLAKIKSRPIKPIINEDFIHNDIKKKKHSKMVKEAEKTKIQEANEQILKKMMRVKSFISTKELDMNYKKEHSKMIKKLRKVYDGKLLLPNITQRTITHSQSNTEATYYSKKIN